MKAKFKEDQKNARARISYIAGKSREQPDINFERSTLKQERGACQDPRRVRGCGQAGFIDAPVSIQANS